MRAKKTNVILTSYPYDGWTPSTLKLGAWSEEKKQEFLNFVRGHDLYNLRGCCINIHFDNSVMHVRGFARPITFTPIRSRNKNNEIIIEIITDEENRTCWPVVSATCPLCIQDGQCTSPLVKKYIGEFLFPKKYIKQR